MNHILNRLLLYDSIDIKLKNRQKLIYVLEIRIEVTFGEKGRSSYWKGSSGVQVEFII